MTRADTIEELKAIKSVMERVSPELVDMNCIAGHDGCGCALYHFYCATGEESRIRLEGDQGQFLFSIRPRAYNPARGAEAKAEFLRRVDLVIEELEQ